MKLAETANNEILRAGYQLTSNLRGKVDAEMNIFGAFCKAVDVNNTFENQGNHDRQGSYRTLAGEEGYHHLCGYPQTTDKRGQQHPPNPNRAYSQAPDYK
ncbi:uncharacterized protein FFNC_15388 [Fusarium fujikuroi]|nr:uncharacterized protein FFNC_15388 [Fusarium fujikuroi]